MMKSKPVVGTLEVILCARLKSLIKKKKKISARNGSSRSVAFELVAGLVVGRQGNKKGEVWS